MIKLGNKKKKIIVFLTCIVLFSIVFSILFLTIFNKEWKKASDNYNIAYKVAEKNTLELEELIYKSEEIVATKSKALEENTRDDLKKSIKKANSAKIKLPIKPLFIKKMNELTKKLKKVNYDEQYNDLLDKYNYFDLSIKKYKLVYKPSEEYILNRLKSVGEIFNITAYTEETDVEKHLGKDKWYYSKIVFQHPDVEHFGLDNDIMKITDIGNPAGGCIEIYESIEDAERRNAEMESYEGTVRSPGSHKIIGTVLVRTSDDLSLSKQKELEQKIIDALTYIETENKEDEKKETTVNENVTTTKRKTETTTKKIKENVVFYGGTTSSAGWNGKGNLNVKTNFAVGDEINFSGKISGFSGKKMISVIGTFPNGEDFDNTFDVQNEDVIGFGFVDCGVGNGSITVKLTNTGEVLGHYEFTIQ